MKTTHPMFSSHYNNDCFAFKHASAKDFAHGNFATRSYSITGSHWNLSTEKGSSSNLVEKLRMQPRKLKELCHGVFQGIVTVGNDIFVLKGKQIGRKFIGWSEAAKKEVELEPHIVKPLLKGENIQRYQPLSSNIWSFYPHYQDRFGKTHPFTEVELRSNYPKAFDYIRPFKNNTV